MKHETINDVANMLLLGRDKLSRGWCQANFESEGKVCMVGAITRLATFDNELVLHRALEELRNAVPTGHRDPISYNDKPGRTKEEVLAVFDKAISNALSRSPQ